MPSEGVRSAAPASGGVVRASHYRGTYRRSGSSQKEVGAVSTLWERVKSGLSVAAREAEDLTRIGKLRLEMLTTQRTIDRTFSELGGRVYDLLTGESKKSIPADKKIKELIERIQQLEKELEQRESDLGRVRIE